jgi:putative ABC transport system permease protein
VNEEFAQRYFPNESPLGKQIKPWSNTPATIVGVVGSARQRSVDRPPSSEIYISAAQRFEFANTMAFVVATTGPEDALMRAAREVVHGVAPQQPVYQLQPMTDVISTSLKPQRLTFVLLACLAGLAVLLSAAGVYGVMSYGVTQRTREIGIRMAIGAQRESVVRMVMLEAGRVAGIGIVVGLLAASMLTKLIASLVFGVSTHDPLTFGGAAVIIALIAAAASLVPALRASRVDPLLAIRAGAE